MLVVRRITVIVGTHWRGRDIIVGLFLVLAAVAFLVAIGVSVPNTLGPWVTNWYSFLNNLFLVFGLPIRDLAENINIPLLTAVLLGTVGALAPCQLSTGAAALAYLSPGMVQQKSYASDIAAYTAGKITIYTVLGGAAIMAGLQMNDSVPFIQFVRKALGPIMLLLALQLFGIQRFRFSIGEGISQWIEARFAGRGTLRAYLLGIAFSLAFCPTMLLLFFGLLIPLAVTMPMGIIYPGLFALGTTLPLIVLATMLALGSGSLGESVRRVGRIERFIRPASAAVLLLAGLNDTIIYWFI